MTKLGEKLDNTKTAQEQGVAIQKSGVITSVLAWINAPTTAAEIQRALPRGMEPARFARIVQTELRKNPALLESEPGSFVLAVLNAAQLGLDFGPLGHAYLTGPFNNSKTGAKETVLILGYKGLMDLAFRSDTIDALDAVTVRDGEPFEVLRGSDNRLVHKELPECADKKPVAYYAIAFPKGSGRPVFEVMYPSQIEAIRKRSRAGNSPMSPWHNGNAEDYDAMAKKTVTRRMLNRGKVRLSVEVAEALALDEQRELGVDRPDVLADLPSIPTPATNGEQATGTPAAAAEAPTEPTKAPEPSGQPDTAGTAAATAPDQKPSGKTDKAAQGKLV